MNVIGRDLFPEVTDKADSYDDTYPPINNYNNRTSPPKPGINISEAYVKGLEARQYPTKKNLQEQARQFDSSNSNLRRNKKWRVEYEVEDKPSTKEYIQQQNEIAENVKRNGKDIKQNSSGLITKIGLGFGAAASVLWGANEYIHNQNDIDKPSEASNSIDKSSLNNSDSNVKLIDARTEPTIAAKETTQMEINKKGKLEIFTDPTISENLFHDVLHNRNGNISETDIKTIYSMFNDMNINPSFALGLFIHESGAGTQGAAVENHSWGNLEYTDIEIVKKRYQDKKVADKLKKYIKDNHVPFKQNGRWRQYDSFLDGAIDFAVLLQTVYNTDSDGLPAITTVEDFVPKFAPSGENDVIRYIKFLNDFVADPTIGFKK